MKYAKCGCPDFNDAFQGVCWGRCKTRRRRPIRVWRILAAVLGAWLALWLLGGDRTPEAATQTRSGQSPIVMELDVTITRFYVKSGIEYYRLNDGTGSAVLAIDSDLPLATWLHVHKKATLR